MRGTPIVGNDSALGNALFAIYPHHPSSGLPATFSPKAVRRIRFKPSCVTPPLPARQRRLTTSLLHPQERRRDMWRTAFLRRRGLDVFGRVEWRQIETPHRKRLLARRSGSNPSSSLPYVCRAVPSVWNPGHRIYLPPRTSRGSQVPPAAGAVPIRFRARRRQSSGVVTRYFNCRHKNVYASDDMNASCLLSAAPP